MTNRRSPSRRQLFAGREVMAVSEFDVGSWKFKVERSPCFLCEDGRTSNAQRSTSNIEQPDTSPVRRMSMGSVTNLNDPQEKFQEHAKRGDRK